MIGNGFDIAHGRKTKYSDFMKWICLPSRELSNNHPELLVSTKFPEYKDSSLMTYLISCFEKKNRINTWIDLEQELKEFVKRVSSLVDRLNEIENAKRDNVLIFDLRRYDISYRFLVTQLISVFKKTDEIVVLRDEFIDIWGKIDKPKVLKTIQKELLELRSIFEFYLVSVEPSLRDKIECKDYIKRIDPSYVISFNYTDTMQELYDMPLENICYIHGGIGTNDMVLGYDDSDDSISDLEFKKYYQRLIYDTDTIDYQRFYENTVGIPNAATVVFYGHSLDISDKDILENLLTQGNPIRIFYIDEDDRNDKIRNLISLIGKDSTIIKLTNKEIVFVPIKS